MLARRLTCSGYLSTASLLGDCAKVARIIQIREGGGLDLSGSNGVVRSGKILCRFDFFFEPGSCCVAQASLKLTIFLPPSTKD